MKNDPIDEKLSGNAPHDGGIAPEEKARISGAMRYLDRIRSKLVQTSNSDTPRSNQSQTLLNGSVQSGTQSKSETCDQKILDHLVTSLMGGLNGQNGSFGRFEIIRKLGEGGFASVFLAFDPRLDRLVALKIPKPNHLLSKVEKERFDREAKAAAMLSHPNIVPILETDHVGTVQYIASEYCDGPTLSAWIKDQSGPIKTDQAARIVIQLAEAVAHAHQRGILHRDLKPGNVLFEKANTDSNTCSDTFRTKITDFGLAKRVNVNQDSLTVDGAILGTPAYMSPEQARGESTITAASDIYSLGVILYELLTGQTPHRGATHVETLHLVSSKSVISPRKIRQEISIDLEAICLKAMDPIISNRYSDAHQLGRDLQNWLDGNPILARKTTTLQSFHRWACKNPYIATAIFAVIASLAMGLTLTLWQYQQSQTNLATSNVQRQRAMNHLVQLETIVDFVLEEFGTEDGEKQELDETQIRVLNRFLQVHQDLIDDEAEFLNVDIKQIDNYVRVAKILNLLGEYEQSIEYIDTAIRLAESVAKDHTDFEQFQEKKYQASFTSFLFVYRNGTRAEVEDRMELVKNSWDWNDPKIEESERLIRQYHYFRHVGHVKRRQQDFVASESAFLDAYDRIEIMIAADKSNRGLQMMRLRNLLELADVNWSNKRREVAISHYNDLLDLFKKLPRTISDHPQSLSILADCQSNLGHAYFRRGKTELAMDHLEASLDTYKKIETVTSSNASGRQVHLAIRIADLCFRQKRHERGLRACEEGLTLIEMLPPSRFKAQSSVQLLSRAAKFKLLISDNLEAAIQDLERAIGLGKQVAVKYPDSGSSFAQLGRCYYYLAEHLIKTEQIEQALNMYDIALDNFEKCHRLQNFRSSPKQMAINSTKAKSKVAVEQDDFEAVVNHWERLFQLRPEEPKFYLESFRFMTDVLHENENAVLREAALNNIQAAIDNGFDDLDSLVSNRDFKIWGESAELKLILKKIGYDE